MKRGLSILGILIALAGIVWTLQGVGILQGSGMSNHSEWAVIGIAAVIVGIGLIVWLNRKPTNAPPTG